jgi:hypothetical protein
LEDDVNIDDVSATLRRDLITSDTVRFAIVNSQEKPILDIVAGTGFYINSAFEAAALFFSPSFLVSFPRQ